MSEANWTDAWKVGDRCGVLEDGPGQVGTGGTVDRVHPNRLVVSPDGEKRLITVWEAKAVFRLDGSHKPITETQVEDPKKPGEAAVAADFARIWQWGLEAELWTAAAQPQRFCDMVIGNLAELLRRRELQKNLARDRRAESEVLMTHHADDLRNLRLEHYEELRKLLAIVRKP